jgi:hypothetical protein
MAKALHAAMKRLARLAALMPDLPMRSVALSNKAHRPYAKVLAARIGSEAALAPLPSPMKKKVFG